MDKSSSLIISENPTEKIQQRGPPVHLGYFDAKTSGAFLLLPRTDLYRKETVFHCKVCKPCPARAHPGAASLN